jgi:UDP-glucose 4-epimerase
MTRSVVTGAAGFVGSTLAERLLDLGHEVTGIDCFTDYYARALKEANVAALQVREGFELIEDDLLREDLEALLDGVEYVFHIAGQAGVRPSWGRHFETYVDCNIRATQRLLEAAKGAALRRFVFASSSSVYGNATQLPVSESALPQPVSPYGVTKLAAEHLCSLYGAVYGLPAASLRLFTVYGPRQRPDMAVARFLRAAATGETVPVFGDGTQTRDFTFVHDAADAHIAAMQSESNDRVFNVCGGSRISVRDLLSLIEDVTGRPVNVRYEERARGDASHTWGDSSLARAELGWQPVTSLRDGIEAQWQWMEEHEEIAVAARTLDQP